MDEKTLKEIERILLSLFAKIGMDKPDNFDQILNFVAFDIGETADPIDWNNDDVIIGLRRWIESHEE